MAEFNTNVFRMYLKAQKNPQLAQRLGESIGDVNEIVKVGQAFGFDFTKDEYLDHLKAESDNGAGQDKEKKWGDATTLALGEEDSKPRIPDTGRHGDVTTMAVGEEDRKPIHPDPDRHGGATTMAVGEEDRKPRKPETPPKKGGNRATTLALGEEGNRRF